MAELISINLAANETKNFRRGGGGFEIIQASYATSINLYSDQGSQIDSLSGALQGFFLTAPFGAFDIKNGSIAQTVQLLLLDQGETGGTRRQSGIVTVTDTSNARARAAQAYIAGYSLWPAVGPNYLMFTLANPAGSNKNAVITELHVGAEIAATVGRINYGFATAAAPNGIASAPSNKLRSGAASVMTGKQSSAETAIGGGVIAIHIGAVSISTTMAMVKFTDPIVLEPGYIFQVSSFKSYSNADGAIQTWIHFYEESV